MTKVEAFLKLYELGEARVGQIDEMLSRISPSQVVLILQNEWKVWVNDKPTTIKKMLERYRKGPLRKRLIDRVTESSAGKHITTLARRSTAMEQLADLVEKQTGRYYTALELEQRSGGKLLLKMASDEGRLLKEMLVELARVQLETGVMSRAPKRVVGTVTDASGAVQHFDWTMEQETLFKEIEAFKQDDGVYAPHSS